MLDRRFLDVSLVVAGIANEPAANPTVGTQYIVGSSPAGDFSGALANQLARYDGSKWIFSTPKTNGLEVFSTETSEILSFSGTEWESKVKLTKAKNTENFTVADYFSCNFLDSEPTKRIGYTPGDIFIIYQATRSPDKHGETHSLNYIYQVDESGTLAKISPKDVKGKKLLINKNDVTSVANVTSVQILRSEFQDITTESENYLVIDHTEDTTPEIVFCKQTQHFYKYNAETDIYDDLGAVSTDDFTEIEGGFFFYYAESNSFYYVDVENNKFGVFPLGSSETPISSAGDEVICENHTLTAEEATAKSFTLANSIKTGKETGVLLSVCGMIQIPGVDYTASGNTISWTGKTLDDIGLQAGDIFVVQYVKG